MRLLLDSATFWWIALDSPLVSSRARASYADAANDVFLSPVSIWELLLKNALGQLVTESPMADVLHRVRNDREIRTLPLTESAVFRVQSLPSIHRDPFDRLLICQALDEGMTLLTPDSQIRAYPVPTLW